MSPLNRVRLVLVGPRHPGNVGACARLAANYDVRDWVIVDAQCRWDDFDARKFATGSATRALDSVREVKHVPDATADCVAAIGFSRRQGKARRPSIALSKLAELIQSSPGKIALVFGNEKTGLTTEELEPCTHLCQLATSDGHPSLNLSHAVAAALSRLYDDLDVSTGRSRTKRRPAKLTELEAMFTHWREFMLDFGLNRGGNPERLLARFRAIFARAQLDAGEIRAIRGLLSKAQVKLGTRRRGKRVVTGLAVLFALGPTHSPLKKMPLPPTEHLAQAVPAQIRGPATR